MKLPSLKKGLAGVIFSGLFLCSYNTLACSNCHSTGQCMPGDTTDSGGRCTNYYYACNECYEQSGTGTADSNMTCVPVNSPSCNNNDGGQ